MSRSRQSARKAGTSFERSTADWLRDNWSDYIDRRVKTGALDKGDISNFRVSGREVVIECKNEVRFNLAGWVKEAQQEAINAGAVAGIVVAKRKGVTDPAEQYVILTLGDLINILAAAN